MGIDFEVGGLAELRERGRGSSRISVAILDGPVDTAHPCFSGGHLELLGSMVDPRVDGGRMSRHGTHVTSVIFGQPGSGVPGIAPGCRGILVPIFSDTEQGRLPQLDLARAIERALEAGADVINVSGGERTAAGGADPILRRAIERCHEQNVLVVAAAGNDGCDCVHVPAALPTVLAVGALGQDGRPLDSSNWGSEYQTSGIVAPGQDIVGAAPGGGLATMSGTSFATPVVTGIVALLLSAQQEMSGRIDPAAVADAILRTATGCVEQADRDCRRFLAGTLNLPGAYARITSSERTIVETTATSAPPIEAEVGPAAIGIETAAPTVEAAFAGGDLTTGVLAAAIDPSASAPNATARPAGAAPCQAAGGCPGIGASGCGCGGAPQAYVYALGTIGFDFGTEARRDTFRQLMPDVVRDAPDGVTVKVSANPYDVFQLKEYLDAHPWESTKLIFTLNLDLTPIYAVVAERDYPEQVYQALRDALEFQALPDDHKQHIARVSIPGRLTGKTVQLYSGQRVPVVVAQPRGLYMWNDTLLVDSVIDAVHGDVLSRAAGGAAATQFNEDYVSKLVRAFLDKVYFECRNLGASSADRALNFAATNAYQFASGIATGLLSGNLVPGAEDDLYALDGISVEKSPFCRIDSDCWDVKIAFFDPVNDQRSRSIYQYTIDVSDEMPVTLAPAHQYLTR